MSLDALASWDLVIVGASDDLSCWLQLDVGCLFAGGSVGAAPLGGDLGE